MIQTSAFYLDKYRFRLQLFNRLVTLTSQAIITYSRNLKAIEHVHLSLFSQEQFSTYIESLAFSPRSEEAQLAHSLKAK